MTNTYDNFDDDEDQIVSKSQRKRDMQELQELGRKLSELNASQRASFTLTADLVEAIEEYLRITKNEAKRRHLQYIGKLMRLNDQEAIKARFAELEVGQSKTIKMHHLVEEWRDQLLQNNQEDITRFMEEFPDTDRQLFRQLVRNAVKEQNANNESTAQPGVKKPATNTRKLFTYLRDIITAV